MFFPVRGNVLARLGAAAVSSDVDHDGNRLILTQIIADRPALWEACAMLFDDIKSASPLDRKIDQ